MYIKKITIFIGLIFCINQIVAQNIYEKELIKGIQAIFQADFKIGIPLIEKNINNKTIDKEGKLIASIALQIAYNITDDKSFDINTLKNKLERYDRKDGLYAMGCSIIAEKETNNNDAIIFGEEATQTFITLHDSINYINALPFLTTAYFRNGNIDKAIELETKRKEYIVHNYGKKNEDYIHSLHELGAYYSHKGEYFKSLELIIEEYELTKSSDVIINLAMAYMNLGIYNKAIESLNVIKENDINYPTSLLYLSLCYEGKEDWEYSYKLAHKALKEYKKRGISLNEKEMNDFIMVLIKAGEYKQASDLIITLLTTTNKESDRIDLISNLIKINRILGEYEIAIKYGREGLKLATKVYGEYSLKSLDIISQLIYCNIQINKDAISLLKLYTKKREQFLSNNLDINKNYQNAFWLYSQSHFDYIYALCTSKWYPSELVSFCYNNNLFMKGTILSYNLSKRFQNINEYDLLRTKWQDIQKHLKDGDIAIEFINYPATSEGKLVDCYSALILNKDWEFPKMTLLFALDKGEKVTNETLDKYPFWDVRLNEYLTPGCNVYFSASGGLHNLPIESMPIGNGKIMSDVYNMHRLSSTRELVKEKKEMKYTKAVLYGGLNYDMTDDELLSASQTYTKDASTEYFVSRGLLEDSIRGYKWDNLSNTQQEVDYISDLMKKNQITTQTYKINKGNEESFKALSGHEYNIIHLATHGFFYPDEEAKEKDYFKPMLLNDNYRMFNEVDMSMWRSGLVMSGGNRAWKGDTIPDTVEDGILKAQEIGDLDLRGADLVVLSACNTGQGEVTGEGVFGLQRAFKMAGAQTIIMSLTPVDDKTTMAMMNKFYTNLFSGQSKHDAFYNAQRYIRSIKPDPKYWMGWIMLD